MDQELATQLATYLPRPKEHTLPTQTVTTLADEIYNHLLDNPHTPYTRKALANAVGWNPNTTFGMALAEARKKAAAAGDCITGCTHVPGIGRALRLLPKGDEQNGSIRPLLTRAAQLRTQTGAVLRDARYTVENAEDGRNVRFAKTLSHTYEVAILTDEVVRAAEAEAREASEEIADAQRRAAEAEAAALAKDEELARLRAQVSTMAPA